MVLQISTRKTKTTKAQAAGPCTSDAKNQDTKGPGFLGLAPLAYGAARASGAQAALGHCMPMAKRAATKSTTSGLGPKNQGPRKLDLSPLVQRLKTPNGQAGWTLHLWGKGPRHQRPRLLTE